MDVVIYYAGPKGILYEKERFKAKTLKKARKLVQEMFTIEHDCAEWNVRHSWIASSKIEAHVYGFCRDEHVAIVLEDKGKVDYLTNEWYDDDNE